MAEERLYHSLIAETACAAGKYVVYGWKLKPFCLLHSLQLSQLGSPVWVGTETAEPEDLIAAAQICANDLPVLEFVEPAEYFDPVEQLHLWLSYMNTCAATPMQKERITGGTGDEFAIPVEVSAAVFLMRELGISESRAWSMPYGLVWWYVETAQAQVDGESFILTEEEAAAQKEMASPEAEAARARLDENARWIFENVTDTVKRAELLASASRDELPEGWRETVNG